MERIRSRREVRCRGVCRPWAAPAAGARFFEAVRSEHPVAQEYFIGRRCRIIKRSPLCANSARQPETFAVSSQAIVQFGPRAWMAGALPVQRGTLAMLGC